MNEQANKALSELIANAAGGLNGAIEFSKQQIPEVVNQLLTWNLISSALTQVVCLAIIALYLLSFKRAAALSEDYGNPYSIAATVFLPAGAGVACSALLIFCISFDWLKILVAPKLYLLEYASHLIKG